MKTKCCLVGVGSCGTKCGVYSQFLNSKNEKCFTVVGYHRQRKSRHDTSVPPGRVEAVAYN